MKTNISGLPVKESELIITEVNILLSNFQVYYQNLKGAIVIVEENVFLICMENLKKCTMIRN